MESSVGFFGQIKYIFKGIAKPRYFNRLSHQSRGCMIGYLIIMTVLSTALYCGVSYFTNVMCGKLPDEINKISNMFPAYEYNNGSLTFEKPYIYASGEEKYYITGDSTVSKADKGYLDDIKIQCDWAYGKTIIILNTDSITVILPFGWTTEFNYKNIQTLVGIPAQFSSENMTKIVGDTINRLYMYFSAVMLVYFLIKAVVTGFVFMGIGFGMVKILKAQYSLNELYNISIYITGVTTVLKRVVNASGYAPKVLWMDIIFLVIVGVYMFFALTGSAEDVGPTSTIVFNKPSSKKFGSVPEEDPFAKKNYGRDEYRSGAFQGSLSSMSTKTDSSENRSYENTDSSYNQTTSSYSSTNETYTETAVTSYAETGSSYEEPQNTYAETNTSYEEPQNTYAETNTSYEEPQSSIVKEESMSFGSVMTSETMTETVTETSTASSAEETKDDQSRPSIIKLGGTYGVGYASSQTGKKKKPKYDRPITAPDSYNGAYYGSVDDDEEEESTYFGKSLLENRGGMYGKTLSAFTPSENKSSVISQPENPFEGINLGAKAQTTQYPNQTSAFSGQSSLYSTQSTAGSSLYTKSESEERSSESVVFTTKDGAEPFAAAKRGYGSYDAFDNLGKSKKKSTPQTYTKPGSSKKITRYTPDDFAAWEREAYAEEFNKPIGGFGRR